MINKNQKDKFYTALVGAVENDGLRLIFPDSEEVSIKRYPYNKALTFQVGQRVLLIPTEGSYVVAFPL